MNVVSRGQVAEFPDDGFAELPLSGPPLVVDLDGTLVKTDLLIESVLALLKQHPLCLFAFPGWLVGGKAWFKQQVASSVRLEASTLPWRTQLVDYLVQQHANGRTLVLATGSDIGIARQVADHLKVFDEVLASDGTVNLCGQAKRDLLVGKFGVEGFDYAADGGGRGRCDLPIWIASRKAILVNPRRGVSKAAVRLGKVDRVFSDAKGGLSAYLNVLRPTHWLKNLLVFVPLLAAHRFHDLASFEKSLLAFVAFGCCASSGYLLNDLFDLESDRHHPQKRFRPLAAGDLPLSFALIAGPVLLVFGCVIGALVSPLLFVTLAAYCAMSAVYSLQVKKVAILDVIVLAGLYTVRIMAGSAATGIWPSHWLLAFSTFLFFSLALAKRYSELVIMRRVDGNAAKARAYELQDGELLAAMGIASGYLAVLVLALYLAADRARVHYSRPEMLWLLCPLLLYWISHVWLTAHRGDMSHDPVVFATGDRTSRILILLSVAAAGLAL
jgi:4-hydroxybenzoate polyprenyltransferase